MRFLEDAFKVFDFLLLSPTDVFNLTTLVLILSRKDVSVDAGVIFLDDPLDFRSEVKKLICSRSLSKRSEKIICLSWLRMRTEKILIIPDHFLSGPKNKRITVLFVREAQ